MSEWVTIDVVDGVGPVAVKHRRPGEDEALLDHEAAVLDALDHPGVVRLVLRRTQPDAALVTHFVGIHSLETATAPDVDDAVAIVADLVRTVEHLHRQGVRHGALDPSHVVLGPGKRPILCGFSGAVGPGADPDVAPFPADDIAGVGRIIERLVAGHDGLEPIPSRRSRREPPWRGYRMRALLMLADHCQADDPGARPSAAGLVAAVDDLLEHDRPGRRRGPPLTGSIVDLLDRCRSTLAHRRAAAAVALGVVGATMAVLAVGSFRSGPVDASEVAAVAAPGAAPTTTTSTTTTTTTTTTTRSCPGRAEGADIDGDGCPDEPATVSGHVVTVGDVRYRLGRPGDRVLVGNWGCDGLTTAVLVRTEPAGVWHFPAWADAGRAMDAVAVSGAVDPASVTRRRDVDGCDVLLATSPPDQTPRSLEVPS